MNWNKHSPAWFLESSQCWSSCKLQRFGHTRSWYALTPQIIHSPFALLRLQFYFPWIHQLSGWNPRHPPSRGMTAHLKHAALSWLCTPWLVNCSHSPSPCSFPRWCLSHQSHRASMWMGHCGLGNTLINLWLCVWIFCCVESHFWPTCHGPWSGPHPQVRKQPHFWLCHQVPHTRGWKSLRHTGKPCHCGLPSSMFLDPSEALFTSGLSNLYSQIYSWCQKYT